MVNYYLYVLPRITIPARYIRSQSRGQIGIRPSVMSEKYEGRRNSWLRFRLG